MKRMASAAVSGLLRLCPLTLHGTRDLYVVTNTQSTPADSIDPRVIDAATAAMVSAIEWDIAIANDASQYSGWLTAFCTGGLAIIASQSDKLVERSAMPARPDRI
jgi:hypothetical protein